MKCQHCVYWQKLAEEHEYEGICEYYKYCALGLCPVIAQSPYPYTKADDSCGHFKLKETHNELED